MAYVAPGLPSSRLKCLIEELESLIEKVAEKFNLYYKGKPRKAFILDALLRYECTGCLLKALTSPQTYSIDSVYIENHKLALSLLYDYLKNRLNTYGVKVVVEEEASGNYGRVDVILKLTSRSLLLNLPGIHVIIEVKCGRSLKYSQLLRYFLLDENVVMIVVWRVALKQIIVFERTRINNLLLFVTELAIKKARAILEGNAISCEHRRPSTTSVLENPQDLINAVMEGLSDLPAVVDALVQSARMLLNHGYLNCQSTFGEGNVDVRKT
ncbi:MAG: hypothetical protein QXJ62_01300 [Nitrososphaeria archaeon]